jgi:hypothetical protein
MKFKTFFYMSASKFFVSALVLVSAFSALPTSSVNTFAESTPSYRIVTAGNGLNIRNSKCNKVGGIGYGNVLSQTSAKTITCTIGGQSVKMINYYPTFSAGNYDTNDAYVAESFTKALNQGNLDVSKYKNVDATKPETYPVYKVNSTGGLNLRDQNCKRIMSVPNGTELRSVVGGGSLKVCKANGEFYSMTDVTYNGKNYMVADSYLQVK